tara:strand:- start:333 stop:590 length:258 start_codon:yes stop_codon:yes gene_type:complete
MVHVGYYDPSIGEGLYEVHMNFFTAAEDLKKAKENILSLKEFQDKKMHIDGIKELSYVDGYKVSLEEVKNSKQEGILGYDESKKL